MTYYHPSKSAAQAAADELMRTDPRVESARPSFVPSNGYVVMVIPKPLDLTDLGDRYEVRTDGGRRLTPRPASHKTPMSGPRYTPKIQRPPMQVVEAKPGEVLVAPPWQRKAPPAPEPAVPAPAPPAATVAPSAPAIKPPWIK